MYNPTIEEREKVKKHVDISNPLDSGLKIHT